MKLHLDNIILEGTPEELVDYQELLKKRGSSTEDIDIQVGDRVKVLRSEEGAEGEATITAVLEDGDVRLEGRSGSGVYSYNWSNHVSNLEKIEEDTPMGYTFWCLEGTNFNTFVVLKARTNYLEDSKGHRYTYPSVRGYTKPIDRENVSKYFEGAKDRRALLKYYPTADVFMDRH